MHCPFLLLEDPSPFLTPPPYELPNFPPPYDMPNPPPSHDFHNFPPPLESATDSESDSPPFIESDTDSVASLSPP